MNREQTVVCHFSTTDRTSNLSHTATLIDKKKDKKNLVTLYIILYSSKIYEKQAFKTKMNVFDPFYEKAE
jgi:hypothetical protein